LEKITMKGQISATSLDRDTGVHNHAQDIAFGITAFGGKVHENITKEAIRRADMTFGRLIDGVKWPDAPDEDENKKPNWESYARLVTQIKTPGTITNDSHFGKYQIWHSMTPDDGTGRVYSNSEVKDLIINQAMEWYEKAQSTGDTFHLGKVLHMVQDSYSRSHVMRDENGKVKNFQSYNEQDAHEHGTADKPQIKTVIENNGIERQAPEDWRAVPGTLNALDASTDILKLYKRGAGSKELADYLRDKVYPFENEQTKDLPAGSSDPRYQKRIAEIQDAPEIQAGEPTKTDLPLAENTPLKGSLREYLTLHHGSENAERIIVSMQASLSEFSHNANQNVQLELS
jgi:hypothetical protein